MKKITLCLCLTLISASLFAQGTKITLSDQATVSLLTVDQYDALWAAFGHASLRIYDPVTGVDRAYDYGVFDFTSPTFYSDFTKGLLKYRVARSSFDQFLRRYEVQGRWVKEQVLNLDSAEVQAVFDYVEWNILPENRYYMYHYFYNNCATLLIDIVQNELGDRVRFPADHLEKEYTLRGLVHDYTYMDPFAQFGIDLILGSNIDKAATPREVAFLPDYTAKAFANAELMKDGQWVPLAQPQVTVLNLPSLREREFSFIFTPARICWLVFVMALLITLRQRKMPLVGRIFDWLVFLILGLSGTLMAYMWFGTDHVDCANNYNLLWALPTHAILAFFLLKTSWTHKVRRYFRLVAIFSLLVVLLWWLWPQDMPNAAIPLVLTAVLRGGRAGFLS